MADLIRPVLDSYIADALAVLNPLPGRVIHVAPGNEVVHDDCCDGQLWTRVLTLTPHVSHPRSASHQPGCNIDYWIASIGLGIVRCAYVMNDDGSAPTAAEITSDGQEMLDDLAALQQAVICNPNTISVLQWSPIGPLGGCHGGEFIFQINVPICACP